MKISDAKNAYSMHLQALQVRRQSLQKALKEQESAGDDRNFDRVELSRELQRTNAQYEATRQGVEGIMARWSSIHDAEATKQQSESAAKAAEEYGKILEVFRRISSGAKVPPSDEKKLMEFSSELYMAAKTMAMMKKENDDEYDSLWEDEEDEEKPSAEEVADNADIAVASPESVAAAAVEAMPEE